MKKTLTVAAIVALAIGLTACEGETDGTTYDDGPNGVIFVPMPGNPVGAPIFF
ncbi:hypothetical protein FDI09_gp58 [Mycobacterium phage Twister]|uniref:Lipoprotein n=2 Tax=Fromanvirus twister TaxID=1993863 RepID=H9NCQ9_9CAUD|nr:hypothetical protein FDI09_gp58 [Mycobacterium phage Twister]AFF28380.1 hypothetical protein TWISTER_37 [Mycobacterium phage Twister]QGJ94715.1 lipoprotein [Mycobacterium phage WalterMcMickey]QLF84437.1 hypothetical protein SEA_TOPANGA_37 [Mycobacterium phage Topanga]